MRVGPWTQPLKWSFIALQLYGIYLASVVLLLLALFLFFFLSLAATFLGQPQPTNEETGRFVLDILLGQPWLIVGIVVAVVVSISLTVGAARLRPWAHWAAMAFIALSIVPVILMIAAFRDWVWWTVGVPYCAGCVAFLIAMSYAFRRYGPWGVPRSGQNGRERPNLS
jgi:hypothetical protein